MKFLLTLLVLVIAVKWWLARARAEQSRPRPRATPPAQPQRILACAHCGLMLPVNEAVFDEHGDAFCGLEHRRLGLRR